MTGKSDRRIGAHLSTSGGVDKAITHAHEIGANCVQIFSGSPRMWRRTPLEKIDVKKVFAKQQELGVSPIFTHALYLVNLASESKELVDKSVAALSHDMEFDAYVKGAGVIVHLGSHQGRGWDAVREQVAELLFDILQKSPPHSRLLIENSAGQKGKLCSDLSEIRWLLDRVENMATQAGVWKELNSKIGWCFDTCHGFAAGYGLGEKFPEVENQDSLFSEKAGTLAGPKNIFTEIDRLDLWGTLVCIHLNDSRDPFASGRDRHENIGQGTFSKEDLKFFVNHPKLQHIPLITEAPGFDKKGPDKENISLIRELID